MNEFAMSTYATETGAGRSREGRIRLRVSHRAQPAGGGRTEGKCREVYRMFLCGVVWPLCEPKSPFASKSEAPSLRL